VTDAIRKEGAVSICQIFYCGRMAWSEVNPAGRVISPSPIPPRQNNPLTGSLYPVPDKMTLFDMEHVNNGFAQTARGVVSVGFYGV
jgi:2,4-dienoyl-CoA reductase-like NADH-dependent reductase (Old Yellow Enzyme family)